MSTTLLQLFRLSGRRDRATDLARARAAAGTAPALPRIAHFDALEPLEPRTLMALAFATGAQSEPLFDHDLLSRLGVSTAASSVPLSTPASAGLFAPLATAGAGSGVTAHSLLGLDRFRADARFSAFTGRGSATVVLDTGIDRDHRFFGPDADRNGTADRILYQYDFADNDADASDRQGHGSHVAGIIAGNDPALRGVAHEAGIIALKVFKDNGTGNFSYIERALQWVVSNASRFNITSVNMSLGDSRNYNSPQALYGISDELAALAQLRVTVVSAAGNSFYELGSAQGVSYPAADRNSLAVGATYAGSYGAIGSASGARANATGPDRLAVFSQRSTAVQTVFAPGSLITSANHLGATATMQGTSMAAPQIAGVVTLAQQVAQHYLGRRLSLDEFRTLFTTTGATIVDGDDEDDNVRNTNASFKRADILALAQGILNLVPGQAPAQPPAATTPPPPPPAAPANRAPTLTSIANLSSAAAGRAASITYATLAAAANEADPDGQTVLFRVQAVTNGTLTKNGQPVTPGVTTLAPGESLVWTPAANASGLVSAFSVVASDGRLTSAAAVPVRVNVNGAPTLTAINTFTAARANTPYTLTYAALAANANESDPDRQTVSFRVMSVLAGTLTKNGVDVTPGLTTLGPNESLVWRPPAGFTSGTRAAFTLVATDGQLNSPTPVAVNIAISSTGNAVRRAAEHDFIVDSGVHELQLDAPATPADPAAPQRRAAEQRLADTPRRLHLATSATPTAPRAATFGGLHANAATGLTPLLRAGDDSLADRLFRAANPALDLSADAPRHAA